MISLVYILDRFSADSHRQISPRDPAILSALLVGGLMFVAPVLGWSLRQIGIPRPFPMLGATAAVGGVYALYVLVNRRLYLGLSVAVLVTSTFSANIPLIPNAISASLGNLGRHVWLFQLQLIALVAAQALRGRGACPLGRQLDSMRSTIPPNGSSSTLGLSSLGRA